MKEYVVFCENDSTYWCGLNTWDKQLRKAQVFHSLKYANEVHSRFKELNLRNVQVCIDIVPENPTNADRIRAMSDEELANFMADRSVNESTLLRLNENHGISATQIKVIKHSVYCAFMQWLKQPAEVE